MLYGVYREVFQKKDCGIISDSPLRMRKLHVWLYYQSREWLDTKTYHIHIIDNNYPNNFNIFIHYCKI